MTGVPTAHSPILITLSGITIDENEEQPSNAYEPISVTLSGIVMEVNNALHNMPL